MQWWVRGGRETGCVGLRDAAAFDLELAAWCVKEACKKTEV